MVTREKANRGHFVSPTSFERRCLTHALKYGKAVGVGIIYSIINRHYKSEGQHHLNLFKVLFKRKLTNGLRG